MSLDKLEKEGRLCAALLFSIGILQIAGFWFAGAMVNGDGPLAIAQPDTPLYLQSARRVAEGFPFSFSDGLAVSTGSTTVLHPFLFSVIFLLGAGSDAAIACSFAINALFYLVFLFAWSVVIRRWIEDPMARLLAIVLLALFGETAYAALAMSDIGLWLAVSSLFVAGLATCRRSIYGTMLVIGPWVRPEGMVIVIAFLLIVLFQGKKESMSKCDRWLAIIGVVSMLGVFALNYCLTGACQFASVSKKGYFATRPFSAAVFCSANDFLKMAGDFFFGLNDDSPRQFYMLPVVGALAFWTGIVAFKWSDWRKLVFPLAAIGGIWTVATSGWQNTNVDRYVAWMMPAMVIFSANGFAWLYRRIERYRAAAVILVVPTAFAAGSMIALWSLFNVSSSDSDLRMKFGRELDVALPAGSTLGLAGNCGIAYPLQHHGIRSLHGIYSPQFEGPRIAYSMEILKNQPETRFDYWLFAEGDDFPEDFQSSQRDILMVGPDGLVVRKADWKVFDVSAALPRVSDGLALRQRVDVGYLADERLAGYEVEMRYGLSPFNVFQHLGELNGEKAYEAGRVVWGSDSMLVSLVPGKDVVVVMRTLREKDAVMPETLWKDRYRQYDFGHRQQLNISVDGKICATADYEVSDNGFSDVIMRIPGTAVVDSVSRIGLMGDHIACCYWFFQ